MDNNMSIKFEIFEKFMAIINIYKNTHISRAKSINNYANKDEFNNIIMMSHLEEAVMDIIRQADYKPSEDMVEKMFITLIEKILSKHDDILAYMVRVYDAGCIELCDTDLSKYISKLIIALNEALVWIMIGSNYTVSMSEMLYRKAKEEFCFD